MRFEFQNNQLQQLYEEPDFVLPRFGNDVTRCFRKVIGIISTAPDERDLYKMRSLHFEKLQGQRMGQHSLKLNDQWRLIVRLVDTDQGASQSKTLVVIKIVDYH